MNRDFDVTMHADAGLIARKEQRSRIRLFNDRRSRDQLARLEFGAPQNACRHGAFSVGKHHIAELRLIIRYRG